MPTRRRLLLAPVAIAVSLGGAANAAEAPPRPAVSKGPYLQHLGKDVVDVRVELSTAALVSVDLVSDDGKKRTIDAKAPAVFHSVHVTGLEPQTHYRYTLRVAGGPSESGELRTAPPDDSTAPFELLIYGDNRSDGPAHAAVVQKLQRALPVDFLVNSGDFVAKGGLPNLWQDFFAVESPLLRSTCVFACVGNHELLDDLAGAAYTRYFGPSEDAPARLYGSFRWGSARFFLLNAFDDWKSGPERTWLDAELARADGEPGLTWRFVVLHQSPWCGGPHGDNEALLAAGVDRLLVKHKVDLVIAGHDHIYERGDGRGLKYLVSGGGGAPLYRDINPEPSTRRIEAAYHFVDVKVTADAVKVVAQRIDGSVLDKCGFTHGAGWDCDKTPEPALRPNERTDVAPARSSRCGCAVPGAPVTPLGWAAAAIASLVAGIARRRSRG